MWFFLVGTQSCRGTKSGSQTSVASASASGAAAPLPSSRKSEEDTEIEPVYPEHIAALEGPAVRLCDARVRTPAQRRAACCGESTNAAVTDACARTLSFAVSTKAITIEPGTVDRCKIAVDNNLAGCGWVGPDRPSLPAECQNLLVGRLAIRTACRSSLECKKGLFCHGLTATRTGVCGPPMPKGAACGGGIDTLASYTLENDFELTHRECEGYCLRGSCQERAALNGACETALQCPPSAHCVRKHCVSTALPGPSTPCLDEQCAPPSRCIGGRCRPPKPEGETCESERECKGGCIREVDAAMGRCGMVCQTPNILDARERARSPQPKAR